MRPTMKRCKKRVKHEPAIEVTLTTQCTCPNLCTAKTDTFPAIRERGVSVRAMLARIVLAQQQRFAAHGISRDAFVVSASAEGETAGVEFVEWMAAQQEKDR